MENSKCPAFPIDVALSQFTSTNGLTKREYLISLFCQGLLSDPSSQQNGVLYNVRLAAKYADLILDKTVPVEKNKVSNL